MSGSKSSLLRPCFYKPGFKIIETKGQLNYTQTWDSVADWAAPGPTELLLTGKDTNQALWHSNSANTEGHEALKKYRQGTTEKALWALLEITLQTPAAYRLKQTLKWSFSVQNRRCREPPNILKILGNYDREPPTAEYKFYFHSEMVGRK